MTKSISPEHMLLGWTFSNEVIEDAVRNNKMLMLDTETSNVCNLRCGYCYRDVYNDKTKLDHELTIDKRKSLIDEAKALGCKTIKIVGAGEPLCDLDFMEQVNHISNSGMIPIIYTNGVGLKKRQAEQLYDLGSSIMLKYNSFDDDLQDELVGTKGYAKKRNDTLDLLIDEGFNDGKPTRLGFDSVITWKNEKEIPYMLRYCRKFNIFPSFKSFIPKGGTWESHKLNLSPLALKTLKEQAREVDEKEFGISYSLQEPYIGGYGCNQLNHALYVDILGKSFHCPGSSSSFGNVTQNTLKHIWNSKVTQFHLREGQTGCPPRWKDYK